MQCQTSAWPGRRQVKHNCQKTNKIIARVYPTFLPSSLPIPLLSLLHLLHTIPLRLPRQPHKLRMTAPRHNLILRIPEFYRRIRKSLAEFIAADFGADRVSDNAAGGEVSDVQVCADSCCEKAAGGYGEGAAEVDHGGDCAAVEDVEAVLWEEFSSRMTGIF